MLRSFSDMNLQDPIADSSLDGRDEGSETESRQGRMVWLMPTHQLSYEAESDHSQSLHTIDLSDKPRVAWW